MSASLLLCVATLSPLTPGGAPPSGDGEPGAPLVRPYLERGDLDGARKALAARLDAYPGDDDALFSLGTVTFLGGIEEFAQFLHRNGVGDRLFGMMPFVRLPVPKNPDPRPVSYEQWREARVELIAKLAEADAILARVDGPVDVRLDLAALRLDLNDDGDAGEDERALSLLGGRLGLQGRSRRRGNDAAPPSMVTHFDRADAERLRGYCDLLSALLETMLAHDAENWWNHCGHLFFAKPTGVPAYLLPRTGPGFNAANVSDAIAAVHHVNFPVRDAECLRKARTHLLGMLGHSRAMWDLILAEEEGTEHEWIPGPTQTSVTGIEMNDDRVAAWLDFLTEAEALLNGETLAPFWRSFPDATEGGPRRGVNLKRVFEEPRRFDLVEWIQGPGAEPYLEQGEVTSPETWTRFQRVFRGNFFGIAVLIN